uniref:Ionotropic glutamate receptor C-terminal domain-containing protein n=1 Tax=Timema poppense TaxID=170557 RepID=A0A7R9D9I7_TIMPO|nr:unnamed protein product [Timema poppensis]
MPQAFVQLPFNLNNLTLFDSAMDSKIGIYQKMWRYMESKKPSVFVSTYEEGVNRVLEGNYAFLMESTMLDYEVQRDCNLTQIGGLLDSKGYGIATPKGTVRYVSRIGLLESRVFMGSPWRDKISLAILELQEKGVIQILYDKWWKNTGDVCNRDDKNKESKANALGVENIGLSPADGEIGVRIPVLVVLKLRNSFIPLINRSRGVVVSTPGYESRGPGFGSRLVPWWVSHGTHAVPVNGGVFVVLLCGLALAILVAILEFCWNSKKNAQTDRQSLCSEMAEELRFAVRCHGSRQRPALKRSCTRCSPGTTYVPAALEMPHINGETGILPMIEMKKSSLSYDHDT